MPSIRRIRKNILKIASCNANSKDKSIAYTREQYQIEPCKLNDDDLDKYSVSTNQYKSRSRLPLYFESTLKSTNDKTKVCFNGLLSALTESEPTMCSDDDADDSVYEFGHIYVCTKKYNALHNDELSIEFAERVQILSDNVKDLVYVKTLTTHKTGYVPKLNISHVKLFLDRLF
jgi:hypothetical protein